MNDSFEKLTLNLGESVDVTSKVISHDSMVDYDTHTVSSPILPEGDDVVLEIRRRTENLVLIGGNPLQLNCVSGSGSVTVIPLETGEASVTHMEQGASLEIQPNNSLYWYEKDDQSAPFIIRDHCDGFDPANEPAAEAVSAVLGRIISWSIF